MANYRLDPDESIILQEPNVMHGGLMAAYTDEILLTNMNFIYVSKGLFGNTKNIVKYPLDTVKVYKGIAQAIIGKTQNGMPALQISFMQGEETFVFQSGSKKDTGKWVNAINQVITGSPSPYVDAEDDEWFFAGAIRDTVGAFKDALGFKGDTKKGSTGSTAKVEPENTTKKCMGCMAPLSGKKGSYVKCKYCDTEQTL